MLRLRAAAQQQFCVRHAAGATLRRLRGRRRKQRWGQATRATSGRLHAASAGAAGVLGGGQPRVNLPHHFSHAGETARGQTGRRPSRAPSRWGGEGGGFGFGKGLCRKASDC